MENKVIEKQYVGNAVYEPRLKTDKLFEIRSFVGLCDDQLGYLCAHVSNHQLKNKKLWDLFVEMFKVRPDAPDRGWRGEYWGKMMRGACWTYKVLPDKELYPILEKTVKAMLKTADKDGRISSYSREGELDGWDMWCRKYILLGMQYFMEICTSKTLKDKILTAMCAHLDYIIDHVGEGEGKKSILETSTWWGCVNSCSILEPVVRMYSLTGNERYLDFATYIVNTGGSSEENLIEAALANEKKPYQYKVTKAYEMMSFFEGVLEYYRVTGIEKYKTAFFNFVDAVLESDYTIIGCSGCTHELFDNSSKMQTEPNEEVMQETCVTVTLMKMLYQALCMSGDAKYADYIERSTYNAMAGSVNLDENTHIGIDKSVEEEALYRQTDEFVKEIGGITFDSYAPLYKSQRNRKTGGFKLIDGGRMYGCCACIGSAGVALLPTATYMYTEKGFVINAYREGLSFVQMPSGETVSVDVETNYPYDGVISMCIMALHHAPFTIGFRVPSFATTMLLDGEKVDVTPNTYYEITRNWCANNEIVIEFPMEMKAVELNGKIALVKGNIVYALDNRVQDINVKVGDTVVADEKIEVDFASVDAHKVTFNNGVSVIAVEYDSCGADWDNPDRFMTVWIDKE